MRAVDAKLDILDSGALRRKHMHVNAQHISEHRYGIADAALTIESKAGRKGVKNRTVVTLGLIAGGKKNLAYILFVLRVLQRARIQQQRVALFFHAAPAGSEQRAEGFDVR